MASGGEVTQDQMHAALRGAITKNVMQAVKTVINEDVVPTLKELMVQVYQPKFDAVINTGKDVEVKHRKILELISSKDEDLNAIVKQCVADTLNEPNSIFGSIQAENTQLKESLDQMQQSIISLRDDVSRQYRNLSRLICQTADDQHDLLQKLANDSFNNPVSQKRSQDDDCDDPYTEFYPRKRTKVNSLRRRIGDSQPSRETLRSTSQMSENGDNVMTSPLPSSEPRNKLPKRKRQLAEAVPSASVPETSARPTWTEPPTIDTGFPNQAATSPGEAPSAIEHNAATGWKPQVIGYKVGINKSTDKLLEASGLPRSIISLIYELDKETLGQHRVVSTDGNKTGPTICWLSQYDSLEGVPYDMQESAICKMCQHKRDNGEKEVECFYFKGKGSILRFTGPPTPSTKAEDAGTIVESAA